MQKLTKKGALLFAAAMAVCAFTLPAVASAASWGVIGSHHTLTSNNLGFTAPSAGGLTSQCSNTSLTANVANAATLTITTATFSGCTSNLPAASSDCTMTWSPTRLPWRATAVTTTNIQIDDMYFDVKFEDMPSRPGSCGPLTTTASSTLTGTLSVGHWMGNGAGQHGLTWTTAQGLTMYWHSFLLPPAGWGWRGTMQDAQQTLTVSP